MPPKKCAPSLLSHYGSLIANFCQASPDDADDAPRANPDDAAVVGSECALDDSDEDAGNGSGSANKGADNGGSGNVGGGNKAGISGGMAITSSWFPLSTPNPASPNKSPNRATCCLWRRGRLAVVLLLVRVPGSCAPSLSSSVTLSSKAATARVWYSTASSHGCTGAVIVAVCRSLL